jgi:hypothetical protein
MIARVHHHPKVVHLDAADDAAIEHGADSAAAAAATCVIP